jgi:glycosyltransferase involved in cell wall biosynthesis
LSAHRHTVRRLALGRRPAGDRIAFFNTWYRGHNNARYAELLPRLERVDSFLLTFPRQKLLRGGADRAWRAVRGVAEPALLHAAERRYRYAFVTELDQLASLSVPVVVDVDDPRFTPEGASLLGRPNVVSYVVTDASAARRFEELGVDKPWHVVPQGVALESLDADAARAIGREHGRQGTTVVGYLASFLLLPGDRGGDNPLYDVSHLLDLWDEIGARVPEARLWLVGAPSASLRRRVGGRSDILLAGTVPRDRLLSYVANFDIALYPRTEDQGVRASKVAEYLGAGVPVVSYDYDVVADVREAGAGILVGEPREFVAAVERLVRNPVARVELGEAARAAGRERDWRVLATRYEQILDAGLPRVES